MRLGAGGKGGDLLVPDVEPLDIAAPTDCIREPVQAIADDAVDALHARGGQGFNELVCYSYCHCFFPAVLIAATLCSFFSPRMMSISTSNTIPHPGVSKCWQILPSLS
jgi:hypothetical protein